jgi:tRNA splicing ligase
MIIQENKSPELDKTLGSKQPLQPSLLNVLKNHRHNWKEQLNQYTPEDNYLLRLSLLTGLVEVQ